MRNTCKGALTGLLILCLLLSALPLVGLAQQETATLRLGDGAPIPYLAGFESELIKSPDSIRGITGALSYTLQRPDSPTGYEGEYQITNLGLTDDFLLLFYVRTTKSPLAPPHDSPEGLQWLSGIVPILLGEGVNNFFNAFTEVRKKDAHSVQVAQLLPLKTPLGEGETLTIGATWNETQQRYEGGLVVTIDRSRAQDPTKAIEPHQEVKLTMKEFDSDKQPFAYDFTVERLARTPLGNRLVLSFLGTNDRDQFLDYDLLDEQGNHLLLSQPSTGSFTLASRVKPVNTRQEVWFSGGEDSKTLRLMPYFSRWVSHQETGKQVALDLAALPATVDLPGNGQIHVASCDLSRDGYRVKYRHQGQDPLISFHLADQQGDKLDFQGITYQGTDFKSALRVSALYWSGDLYGSIVPRVPESQWQQARKLIIDYAVGARWLQEDHAVTIPNDFSD